MDTLLYNKIYNIKFNNDKDSMEFMINKFYPLILKYSKGNCSIEDSISDLILFLIELLKCFPIEKSIFKEDKYIVSYIHKSMYHHSIKILKDNLRYCNEISLDESIYNYEYNSTNIIFFDLISTLSYKEQQLFIRKFLLNYKTSEIASDLKISPQNVSMSISRALNKLRKGVIN